MTDFLYANPSTFYGVARTLDLFGVFDQYNLSPTPRDADRRAMRSDWLAIGQDFFVVLSEGKAQAKAKGLITKKGRKRHRRVGH